MPARRRENPRLYARLELSNALALVPVGAVAPVPLALALRLRTDVLPVPSSSLRQEPTATNPTGALLEQSHATSGQ
jgi:hypothetical protein